MANEYILLKPHDEAIGQIALTKEAFELIAKFTLEDNEHIELDSPTLRKALVCKIIDNKLNISLDIKVRYGQNVNTLTERLQKAIVSNISKMTDVKNCRVDISVVGFIFGTH
ncbi:MAG TPA: hypothetical protein DEA51_06040 [Erysipelotrichaceae bacterium]|nr:hypothetical protein [Erysipelotrichaceae bacterium]